MSAKQKLSPPRLRGRFLFFSLLGFLFLCGPAATRADSLEDAARALARRVFVSMKRGTATFEMENFSDLKEAKISNLSLAFQDELRRRGAKIAAKNGNLKIRFTISKNAAGYLGIARLEGAETSETFIDSLGQSAEAPELQQSAGLTLRRELILSSDQPILDLIFPGGDTKRIEVLEHRQITSYEREGDHWIRGTSVELPRNRPIERDSRGRLGLGIDHMSAVFSTEACSISMHDNDDCHDTKRPLRFSEASDQAIEDIESPPWITATEMLIEGKRVLLVVGIDGKLRIYEDDPEPIESLSNFGDQVTSIQSDCGGGWQALVTLRGDRSKLDSVQGIEIQNQKAVTVTPAVQFAGPVIALHRAGGGLVYPHTSAIAIILNLYTGLYEAYRLSITCAN